MAGVCFTDFGRWRRAASSVALTLPWLNIFWIWAFLALRDLDFEATLVWRALERGDIIEARRKLALIVGRDTDRLDEPEILRAAIETIAENLSDGVIAPLFYLALGGPVAMAAYKAINTLDSMVGYRNERYAEFGWASARLDDVANFVPARLAALLCGSAPRARASTRLDRGGHVARCVQPAKPERRLSGSGGGGRAWRPVGRREFLSRRASSKSRIWVTRYSRSTRARFVGRECCFTGRRR